MSHVIYMGWIWTAPARKERAMLTGLLRDIGNKPIRALNLPKVSTIACIHLPTMKTPSLLAAIRKQRISLPKSEVYAAPCPKQIHLGINFYI
jgi:hypothetical protein